MALPIAKAMAISPLADVRARIAGAARLAGREPDAVALIAVSKTRSVEEIEGLIAEGHQLFGENRVQEAQAKWAALRASHPEVRLHLIGRLQSNKAHEAVGLFDASIRWTGVAGRRLAGARPKGAPARLLRPGQFATSAKGGCALADLPGCSPAAPRRRCPSPA